VLGNPLGLRDPRGLCSIKDGDTAASDDPNSPCVAPGDNSVSVDGGSVDEISLIWVLSGSSAGGGSPPGGANLPPPARVSIPLQLPTAPNSGPGTNQHLSCLAQRVANSIPNATLTGNNTYQGGHKEFGLLVSGAGLTSAGFSPFTSPFGNGNGYRSLFNPIHVNGQPGNISTISYSDAVAVQGHFDVGNASLGFWGGLEHTFVDVIIGTLFSWIPGLHSFLDPRC